MSGATTGSGISGVSQLHRAIKQIAAFYKLSNEMTEALLEPVENEGVTPNGDILAGEHPVTPSAAAVAQQIEQDTSIEFIRDLLFSSAIGHLPAAEMVHIIETNFGEDVEKMSIIAIQPHGNNGGDLLAASVTGKPWPRGTIFAPADEAMTSFVGASGHVGMLNYTAIRAALEEEESTAINRTKIYHVCSTHGSFSRSAADSNALTVFFNAIPTHEWSRAVPYLDVQFFQDAGVENQQSRAPNLYRFLLGDASYAEKDAESLAKARHFDVDADDDAAAANFAAAVQAAHDTTLQENLGEAGSFSSAAAQEAADAAAAAVPLPAETASWVSGMEVFTSPQTLVRADERTSGIGRQGGLNPPYTGVIDPFRPFMSLLGFTVSIHPKVNNIVFTEGVLKLKLHDRSRMAEISGLVSPGGFGNVFLKIKYGWSHPDGLDSQNFNNPFGKFINSMQTEEHFTISTADYSFTQSGEVDITCKVYSRAAGDLTQDCFILDDLCSDELRFIQKFENACLQASNHLPTDATPGYPSRSSTIVASVESSDGAYALDLTSAGVRGLQTRINRLKNTPEPELEGIAEDLESSLTQLPQAKQRIVKFFNEKLRAVATGEDPWLSTISATAMRGMHGNNVEGAHLRYLSRVASNNYVSLAKVLSIFVAQPLSISSSNNYSEIQLFYGCINHNASYASDLSLASYPIRLDGDAGLIKGLKRLRAACGYNITLGDFIGFINNYFFENHRNPIYGFSGDSNARYEFDDDTGLTSFKYSNERAEQRSADYIASVLKDAYSGDDRPFACPVLSFSMRTAPIATIDGGVSAHSNQHLRNASSSILRVYFEDMKSTPYNGAADAIRQVFNETLPGQLDMQPSEVPANTHGLEVVGTYNSLHLKAEMLRLRDTLQDFGIIELEQAPDGTPTGAYKILAGSDWKGILKSLSPYIDVGSSNSGLKNISMSNQSGGNLQTINMLRGNMGQEAGADQEYTRVPMQMMPQKCSATFFGCPFLVPMQQFFIDMRTGTDIDSLYGIVKISHTLAPGKFETKAEMLYQGGYALFQPAISKINRIAAMMASGNLDEDADGTSEIIGIPILSTDPATAAQAVADRYDGDEGRLLADTERIAHLNLDEDLMAAQNEVEAARILANTVHDEATAAAAGRRRRQQRINGGNDLTSIINDLKTTFDNYILAIFRNAANIQAKIAGQTPEAGLVAGGFMTTTDLLVVSTMSDVNGGTAYHWYAMVSAMRNAGCDYPSAYQGGWIDQCQVPARTTWATYASGAVPGGAVSTQLGATHRVAANIFACENLFFRGGGDVNTFPMTHFGAPTCSNSASSWHFNKHKTQLKKLEDWCVNNAGTAGDFIQNSEAPARRLLKSRLAHYRGNVAGAGAVGQTFNSAFEMEIPDQSPGLQTAILECGLQIADTATNGASVSKATQFTTKNGYAHAFYDSGGAVGLGLTVSAGAKQMGPMTSMLMFPFADSKSDKIVSPIFRCVGIREYLAHDGTDEHWVQNTAR